MNDKSARDMHRLAVGAGEAPTIEQIDAAMVEMRNIVPPLSRTECARLIGAALAAPPAIPEVVSEARMKAGFEAAMIADGYECPERNTNGGYLYKQDQDRWIGYSAALAQAGQAAPAGEVASGPMEAEFTDTARAALLWVLWHHQGGSSKVGQPIRFALGMGAYDRLSDYQVRQAKRWEALTPTPSPSESEQTDSALPDGGAVEKYAARYRFLRDQANPDDDHPHVVVEKQDSWGIWRNVWTTGEALDAAIDRAAASKKRGA